MVRSAQLRGGGGVVARAAGGTLISSDTMNPRYRRLRNVVEEIAHAARRLYPTEDDYSGLGALDPNDPDVLYISTDADPVKGTPLISRADNKRHYELFRGERRASGTWTFTPFTYNSAFDNLRPIIPKWNDRRTAIVWMRGSYVHNQGEWYSAVVAAVIPPRD